MKVWRVSPARTLADACRSEHAGRWNWASRPMLYGSSTPELAALEALAHLAENPVPHWLSVVHLPRVDSATPVRGLTADWRKDKAQTREIGNRWFDRCGSAALLVPSALCPEASNVLVNPHHRLAAGMRLQVLRRFDFDRRLARGS